MYNIRAFAAIIIIAILMACNSNRSSEKNNDMNTKDSAQAPVAASIKEEPVSFTVSGKNYIGYVTYDENTKEKRPGILVIPEWWGLNDYARGRARQLAELGYIAMAVDMYGDGRVAPTPSEAQTAASVYYKDPLLIKPQIDAALEKLKAFPQTDTSQLAAIGYCFGGFIALNAAKEGAGLKGVVSFHGGLEGVKPPKGMATKILVCHGGADEFENPHVAGFKKEMDSAGADYVFKIYPGAKHAFSNPAATENGKKFNMAIAYNAAADTASWNDMKDFFKKLF